MRSPPTHIRIEAALGRAGVALLALTLVLPDWIEKLFGLAPDVGDGSVEWGMALTFVILAIVLAGQSAHRRTGAARSEGLMRSRSQGGDGHPPD